MEQQIFSDGIGRISVIGGVVRLDLVTYSATETDGQGQPRAVLSQRIVMSAESFLRSSEKVLQAAQQLGRVGQTPAAPQAQPQPQKPQPPAPPPTPPQPPAAQAPTPQRAEPVPPQPAPSPWSTPPAPRKPFP